MLSIDSSSKRAEAHGTAAGYFLSHRLALSHQIRSDFSAVRSRGTSMHFHGPGIAGVRISKLTTVCNRCVSIADADASPDREGRSLRERT